tara:strand:+ start:1486 stop:2367 length:882 start_codon:yes stop_codon:yes gene_type:complete
MKKVLIIGGSGFLGSHIADYFSKINYDVTIFDKKKTKWPHKKQKMITASLNNFKKLNSAIKSSDIVYHLAAISDIGECMINPIRSAQVNIMSTISILNLCAKYKIKRFVFASTIYINSEQGGFYKITKLACERYIEEYYKRFNLNYSILRFGTVYGPRADKKNNLSKIIGQALRFKILRYSGKSIAERQYINVIDAAKASVEILKNKYQNKNILITGKKSVKITEIMSIISKKLKINKKVIYEKITEHGHYSKNPYTYKIKPEIKLFPKKPTKISDGILSVINELINNSKTFF